MDNAIAKATRIISEGRRIFAFTGAGISVESGIPAFRGPGSVWERYDPRNLDIDYFVQHPEKAWPVIKQIFYNFMGSHAQPNAAHRTLALMEAAGHLDCVVTQNIDGLHQSAGSKRVHEFHGTASRVVCLGCRHTMPAAEADLSPDVPRCPLCGAVLKPDFVFFGEGIPADAYEPSSQAARHADVCIVVGTSGEVTPAGMIPIEAKRCGATVVEINTTPSTFTRSITDVFVQGKAAEVFAQIRLPYIDRPQF